MSRLRLASRWRSNAASLKFAASKWPKRSVRPCSVATSRDCARMMSTISPKRAASISSRRGAASASTSSSAVPENSMLETRVQEVKPE
ncbi:hypothetical protein D3C71_1612970 [compost metagenome]